MKSLSNVSACVFAAAVLAGCAGDPATRQAAEATMQANYEQRHAPLSKALIGPCIAAAKGQTSDMTALMSLGYTKRLENRRVTTFQSPDASSLSGAGLSVMLFHGKGCRVLYNGNAAQLQTAGNIYVQELRAQGHQIGEPTRQGVQFTADGLPMEVKGVSTASGSTIDILRRN